MPLPRRWLRSIRKCYLCDRPAAGLTGSSRRCGQLRALACPVRLALGCRTLKRGAKGQQPAVYSSPHIHAQREALSRATFYENNLVVHARVFVIKLIPPRARRRAQIEPQLR